MYYYKVEFWDDLDHKKMTESGMTWGNSYGDATDRLIEYYGEDNVFNVSISQLESVLPEEDVIQMFHNECEDDKNE